MESCVQDEAQYHPERTENNIDISRGCLLPRTGAEVEVGKGLF